MFYKGPLYIKKDFYYVVQNKYSAQVPNTKTFQCLSDFFIYILGVN